MELDPFLDLSEGWTSGGISHCAFDTTYLMACIERCNDFVEYEEMGRQQPIRRRPVLHDRFDAFAFHSESNFRLRDRFYKKSVDIILDLIEPQLRAASNRNNPVSPRDQLLVTLRYFATGAFQMTDGDLFGIHQSPVSRIVHRVSRVITSMSETQIRFPIPDDQRKNKVIFYQIVRFPGVIG